ncbi:MAG: aldo/keto reductase [Verrucomicrobia bacterium]|nr:aldo/keto reductase [Verrucomicrobiota bacterium]MDA1065302.1 aldo/keto reductase [Verrucomicrobiota bacterium]
MKYRRFGKTELSMPVISCGGMRYHHKWDDVPWEDIPKEGQENIERILAYALEKGINHIETARGYGSSEMQLGHALKQFPRESYLLQTKIPPQDTEEAFLKVFETSMDYLQQEYVDLFSLHGLNNRALIEKALKPGGSLEIAQKLKEQGRVKHIGFSTHASNDEITEIINSGEFEYVNLHWYFTNQLNSSSIEAAAKQDMGVFIISPNDKGGQLYKPPQKLLDLCDPLDPMVFNGLFCLANPHVHTLSCGAAKPEDFDLHIQGLEHYDVAEEITKPIVEKLEAEVASLIDPHWLEEWHQGIPAWQNLPQKINVLDILRLWTWAKAIDLSAFGKWRYNMLSADDIWILGNPVKPFDDQEMIAALKGNRFAEKIPNILREAHHLFGGEKLKRISQS